MSSKSDKTSKPSTMGELLASYKSPYKPVHKGETVEGVITKITSSEVLIDISAKSEALVLERDKRLLRNLLSRIKVGDKVLATVISEESEFGNPLVSLRHFMDDIAWKKLEEAKKERKAIEVLVSETTKGGLLVNLSDSGLSGFLPFSHMNISQNTQNLLGKKISVFVLDLNREDRKIIFSQKQIFDFKEFEELTKTLKHGQKIDTIVSHITPFGVFVSLPVKDTRIDGLIHISEIGWDKVENLEGMFTVGEKREAVVIGIDKNAKRIDLSVKRLTKDPFEEKTSKFSLEQKVSGKVASVGSFGIAIDLGDGVEGFIRKEKIPPTVSFKAGDEIKATISQIDKEKHRIILIPVLKEKPIGYR